ncbi:monofunctional biosynthetic peptidoglycan transglycosylase [Flavobacterium magnum]|uniref:Biosynthetic peptidoglycan transglycosylase n=1 Tax=Flavobacterium magnum TaxID=2162713 RepID=A0A2S0RDI4_9FLAO|nr:monofunctional biosynthetic peptidoglycan transglycosylase [Flavobacterium magnum]AWA29318.1 monofunctional biosynthetic peptidoglycan transglycosylase [Flavobacterium magnum]
MATKITKRKPAKQGAEKASTKKQTRLRKAMRLILKVMLWFFGLSIFSVIVFKWVPVPFTPLMITRSIEQKWDGREMVCKHDWVPIEDISINMQKAVIASEDATFLKHNGFDFKAMKKAMKNNEKGKRLRGGSTISQQTAKNVFLWQGRSYIRKGFEAYFTVLIELIWGKERIMEVYLNSIEMGDGIYGVEAASQYWYRKKADDLSKRDAAGIAAILPNPRKFKASNSSSKIERRKSRIINHMRYVGKLDY